MTYYVRPEILGYLYNTTSDASYTLYNEINVIIKYLKRY